MIGRLISCIITGNNGKRNLYCRNKITAAALSLATTWCRVSKRYGERNVTFQHQGDLNPGVTRTPVPSHGFGAKFSLLKMSKSDFGHDRKFAFKM